MKNLYLSVCLALSLSFAAKAQQPLRIMFYNAENFFDTEVDSSRSYNAFTPDGEQHWNLKRYLLKKNNLFKTIIAAGKGNAPALLGLCELENEKVLRDLVLSTPLKAMHYKIVHYESPDRRGIDVGMLYRADLLTLLSSSPIAVRDPSDVGFLTRDILFAAFETKLGDTLYFYVNHWPSRYGGQLESVEKRFLAAKTLRLHFDSLAMAHKGAKAIMMGDFNDTPADESLIKMLKAHAPEIALSDSSLIQMFFPSAFLGFEGTLKHGHDWQIFDQFIISGSLLNQDTATAYCAGSARIFAPDFLLTEDERYLGKKLLRTYSGPTYIGGYSDHLPVLIDLCLPKH